MKIHLLILCLLFSIFNATVKCQNVIEKQLLIKGLDKIYQFEFESADSAISKVDSSQYPQVYNFLKSQFIRWSQIPIHEQGEKTLAHYQQFIETPLKPASILDSLLLMNNKLLRAEYYYNNSQLYLAFKEALGMYNLIEPHLEKEVHQISSEWLLAVSLYNYYYQYYQENNLMLANMMWLFEEGDKNKGLKGLTNLTQSKNLAQTEAMIYLSHIYLRIEDEPDSAFKYSSLLHKAFPGNLKFYEFMIESSLVKQQTLDAIPELIDSLRFSEKDYFKKYGLTYHALYQNKDEPSLYKSALLKSLEEIEKLGGGNHLKSLIYKALYAVSDGREKEEYERLVTKLRKYNYTLTSLNERFSIK